LKLFPDLLGQVVQRLILDNLGRVVAAFHPCDYGPHPADTRKIGYQFRIS
jgi:hypothetical protein